MTFHKSAGRFWSTSGSGFDTSERLLKPVKEDPVVGSFTTSSRTFANFAYVTHDTVIASVWSQANHVEGSVKISVLGTSRGITNKGYFDASGSMLIAMAETWPITSSNTTTEGIGTLVWFTFLCAGGQLILREEYKVSPMRNSVSSPSIVVNPHTLDYYLYPMAI